MKKRAIILSILTVAVLVICTVALSACGKDKSEEHLSFTSNGDGTCYVSGIGDCTLEEILIPQVSPKGDRVTAIGDKAFYECFTLKKVTIPATVTKIGSEAFRGCIYLTEVDIPKSVTSIGDRVLMDCKSLTKITVDSSSTAFSSLGNCLVDLNAKAIVAGCNTSQIPNMPTITSISDYAFFDLNNLAFVNIGDYITTIGDHAFDECDNLATVNFGSSVKEIGDYAFAACAKLKNISFGEEDTLESIGDFAFHACDALVSFKFPTTLKSVGQGAFWSCNSFKMAHTDSIAAWAQIEFGSTSATPLNYGSLYCNNEMVLDVVIPAGVEKIGAYAFYNAKDITSVVIPDSVTTIGDYAFGNCAFLDEIKLSEGVKTVGEHAFSNCTSLTKISFPASIESIGEYALFNCSALKSITVAEENAKYSSNGNCLIEKESKTLINGCNSSKIPSDVTSIANYAFYNCSSLKDVTIPKSVTSIGFKAFSGCNNLTNIVFEDASGWKIYESLHDKDGEAISDPEVEITSTCSNYYWKK